MTSEQQLTRAHRATTSSFNRTTRQVVPAFLQKLYEMVNDPSNADLIRWSDAGDSFFVLDHERFAREVLGRWFKHQNFSSFVRQLNMYGFHKIPHLQQGVLRSDSETEFWNFEHPSFHRGQPDLLCLIQRKKQVTQSGSDDISATSAGDRESLGNASATAATLPNGQVLDMQSIINGIAAIKRHQATISAELNELKRSNQLLWQDALEARARHQKHQDTINRILKFLAGVFGHHGNPVHKDDGVDSSSPRAVFPRKAQRLMIEEGPRKEGKGKTGVVQIEEEDDEDRLSRDNSSISMSHPDNPYQHTGQYPIMETPGSAASPYIPQSPSSTYVTPVTLATQSETAPSTSAPPDTSLPRPTTAEHQQQVGFTQPVLPSSFSPSSVSSAVTASPGLANTDSSTTSNTTSPSQDALMQAAFQHVLQSPGQMQRLFAALASHSVPDLTQSPLPSSTTPSASITNPQHQLAPYNTPSYDFSRLPQAEQYPLHLLSPSNNGMDINVNGFDNTNGLPSTDAGLIPFDPALGDSMHKLEKDWKAREDIDKDVNILHSNISSLLHTLGLDPNIMDQSSGTSDATSNGDNSTGTQAPAHIQPTPSLATNPTSTTPSNANTTSTSLPDTSTLPDFDFDAFLSDFPGPSDGNMVDYVGDMASTAFLDEVPSPSDGTASPVTSLRDVNMRDVTAGAGATKQDIIGGAGVIVAGTRQEGSPGGKSAQVQGRKRKSDVAALDSQLQTQTQTHSSPAAKSKRKR